MMAELKPFVSDSNIHSAKGRAPVLNSPELKPQEIQQLNDGIEAWNKLSEEQRIERGINLLKSLEEKGRETGLEKSGTAIYYDMSDRLQKQHGITLPDLPPESVIKYWDEREDTPVEVDSGNVVSTADAKKKKTKGSFPTVKVVAGGVAAGVAISSMPVDSAPVNTANAQAIVRPVDKGIQGAYGRLEVIRHHDDVEADLGLNKLSGQSTESKNTIEASVTPDTYGPQVTKEWLEANPQTIWATADITDTTGVVKQLVVLNNGIVYEGHKGTNGLFTDYVGVSQSPMGHARALAVSPDGSKSVMGGEKELRTSEDSLAISYDGEKTWKNIPWPEGWPISGGAKDIVWITNDTFLVNNVSSEGGIGQVIGHVNVSTGEASLQALNLTETLTKTSFNIGGAHDLQVTSYNPLSNTFEIIANGSSNLRTGLIRGTVNSMSGEGNVEHITTVKININGQEQDINLGYLYGRGIYKDSQGHTHFVASNVDRQLLYDIDMDARTATQMDYSKLLDGKGIENYMAGRLRIYAVDAYTDSAGNPKKILAGTYAKFINGVGTPRAVLLNEDGSIFYDLESLLQSGISQQKSLQKKRINNQLGYEVNINGLGKAFIPVNEDGSLIPNGEIYYTDRGLGTDLPNPPDPLPYKLFLSAVTRGYTGGW